MKRKIRLKKITAGMLCLIVVLGTLVMIPMTSAAATATVSPGVSSLNGSSRTSWSQTTTSTSEIEKNRNNGLKYDASMLSLDTSRESGVLKMALRIREPFGFMTITSPLYNGEPVELSSCDAEFGFVFLATAEPLSPKELMASEDAKWVVGYEHKTDPTRFVSCYEDIDVSNVEQTVYFIAYIRDPNTGDVVATSKTAQYITPYLEIQNGANGKFSTGVTIDTAESALYASIVEYKKAYDEYFAKTYQQTNKLNYFDVVSYNIVKCINIEKGGTSIDPNAIVDVLCESRPEVIILNEVDINNQNTKGSASCFDDPNDYALYRSYGGNQAKYIAEKLTQITGVKHYWAFMVAMNGFHTAAYSSSRSGLSLDAIYGCGEGDGGVIGEWLDNGTYHDFTKKYEALYGEALITTYPIESFTQRRFAIEGHNWDPYNGKTQQYTDKTEVMAISVAEINVNGTIVSVMPSHFGFTSKGNLASAPEAIKDIKKLDTPIILAGDLNNYIQYDASAYDNTLALMMQYLNITVDPNNPPATFHKGTCIDFIFVSDDIEAGYAWSDTTKHASDHYPVYSRMAVT